MEDYYAYLATLEVVDDAAVVIDGVRRLTGSRRRLPPGGGYLMQEYFLVEFGSALESNSDYASRYRVAVRKKDIYREW